MKYISVSNLTLDLWLNYVKPAYGSDTAPEDVADEISHCMTVACFNAHQGGRYQTIEEALQMLYQLAVSAKYRKATSDAMLTLAASMVRTLNH